MIHKFVLLAGIALAFASSCLANRWLASSDEYEISPDWQCRRIISLSPSLTETLYALGLGDRVVGVTRYCSYPAEVAAKPKIGGYFDPNYEAILALRPDLVVMLEEHEQGLPGFQKLHLETRVVCHKNIRGIIDSIRSIGRICGRGPEARRMAKDIEDRLQTCQSRGSGLPHPRVLFSVDRTPMPGHLVDVYIAGHDGYFDEMIRLAGGQNAFSEEGVRYPVVSAEGILAMNPEVIIDLVVGPFQQQRSDEALAADWNELAEIDAVKQHRVHVLRADYACVPGPRFVQVVEDIARILHPEADQAEQTGTQDLP